jgi:hypothetical protein
MSASPPNVRPACPACLSCLPVGGAGEPPPLPFSSPPPPSPPSSGPCTQATARTWCSTTRMQGPQIEPPWPGGTLLHAEDLALRPDTFATHRPASAPGTPAHGAAPCLPLRQLSLAAGGPCLPLRQLSLAAGGLLLGAGQACAGLTGLQSLQLCGGVLPADTLLHLAPLTGLTRLEVEARWGACDPSAAAAFLAASAGAPPPCTRQREAAAAARAAVAAARGGSLLACLPAIQGMGRLRELRVVDGRARGDRARGGRSMTQRTPRASPPTDAPGRRTCWPCCRPRRTWRWWVCGCVGAGGGLQGEGRAARGGEAGEGRGRGGPGPAATRIHRSRPAWRWWVCWVCWGARGGKLTLLGGWDGAQGAGEARGPGTRACAHPAPALPPPCPPPPLPQNTTPIPVHAPNLAPRPGRWGWGPCASVRGCL